MIHYVDTGGSYLGAFSHPPPSSTAVPSAPPTSRHTWQNDQWVAPFPPVYPNLTAVQFHGILDDNPTVKTTLEAVIAAIPDDVTRRRIRGKLRADASFNFYDDDMVNMNAAVSAVIPGFDLSVLWVQALQFS